MADQLRADGATPAGASAYWRLQAPAGTRVVSATLERRLETAGDTGFDTDVRADDSTIDRCAREPASYFCESGAKGEARTYAIDAASVSLGITCVAASGCNHGADINAAKATLYGATVTIEDPVAPTLSAPVGGLLGGGWLRGTVGVSASGSDATGVKGFSVVKADGTVVGRIDRACDYGRTVPCGPGGQETPSGEIGVDTGKLGDGVHAVRVRVVDAADNPTDSAPIEVKVDNTAPAAAGNVRNGRDAVWAAKRTQSLRWDVAAGEVSPITGAAVAACDSRRRCVGVSSTAPTGATVRLPRKGLYRGTVTLTDAAGNVGAAAAFAVGYDASKPRRPRLVGRTASGKRRARTVRVKLRRDAGPAPVSRLAARICRRGAKRCRALPTAGTKRIRLALKGDGRRVLRVRAVDAAGNRSREVVRRLR